MPASLGIELLLMLMLSHNNDNTLTKAESHKSNQKEENDSIGQILPLRKNGNWCVQTVPLTHVQLFRNEFFEIMEDPII